uniref:Uncharacterized protein n=1 Tax=Anguilla anguilla TaxID=7936 RepID=A0A0E9PVX1_ANGAN
MEVAAICDRSSERENSPVCSTCSLPDFAIWYSLYLHPLIWRGLHTLYLHKVHLFSQIFTDAIQIKHLLRGYASSRPHWPSNPQTWGFQPLFFYFVTLGAHQNIGRSIRAALLLTKTKKKKKKK